MPEIWYVRNYVTGKHWVSWSMNKWIWSWSAWSGLSWVGGSGDVCCLSILQG